jgi:putative DNA primase/helicase
MYEADNIRAAPSFVPAYDRDIWLRIGMAIKSELGEQGLNLWLEWSQQDEGYDEKAAHNVWRSIKPNGKVTIATLFYEAKRDGFKLNGKCRFNGSTPEGKAQRKHVAQ